MSVSRLRLSLFHKQAVPTSAPDKQASIAVSCQYVAILRKCYTRHILGLVVFLDAEQTTDVNAQEVRVFQTPCSDKNAGDELIL